MPTIDELEENLPGRALIELAGARLESIGKDQPPVRLPFKSAPSPEDYLLHGARALGASGARSALVGRSTQ